MQRITNMDSLLQIFRRDMAPFKDSFSDPLTSKRIDFVTDAKGRKKIRIQQFQPEGSDFIINNGDVSSLKVAQDTINIIGVINQSA